MNIETNHIYLICLLSLQSNPEILFLFFECVKHCATHLFYDAREA